MSAKKAKQVYLLYGEDEVKIGNDKNALIDSLIKKEEKAQNVTVFAAVSSSHPLRLSKIITDVITELTTVTFLEDSKRLVVIEDLLDFRGAEAKKESPSVERLINFLKNSLTQTNNYIIFSFLENSDKMRFIDKYSELFKTIKEIGEVIEYKVPAIVFKFNDALMERRQNLCLTTYRKMVENGKSYNSIFNAMVKQIRFLLQAKILNTRDGEKMKELLPKQKEVSLLEQHPFVVSKVKSAAGNFSIQELCNAIKQLHEIDFYLHPSQNDVYVPDIDTVMELFLIRFCKGIA